MSYTLESLGLDRLTSDERMAVLGLLWDSLVPRPGASPLSDARRAELQRRVAEDDANPDDTVLWEDAKSATLSRLGS